LANPVSKGKLVLESAVEVEVKLALETIGAERAGTFRDGEETANELKDPESNG